MNSRDAVVSEWAPASFVAPLRVLFDIARPGDYHFLAGTPELRMPDERPAGKERRPLR